MTTPPILTTRTTTKPHEYAAGSPSFVYLTRGETGITLVPPVTG